MPGLDLFTFFRTTLFIFLGIYSLLLLVTGLLRLKALFSGSDRTKEFLRLYVSYELLTIRLKPLRGELVQIAVLVCVLAGVWWLHTLI
jgi:hypothetical protein